MNSPSIIKCKNKIIKYSENSIIFFEKGYVYKQFVFNKYKWINELFVGNYLNHDNIIKFKKCEIINDYVIDTHNKEIRLDKKEKMLRLTMDKYDSTINELKNFTDTEILFIITSILSAIINCINNKILHRDIKEKNIFVKYELKSLNNKGKKKRNITNVVLADFNISKYNYNISSLNRQKIMTVTHRPPEISNAVKLNQHFDYDERVDVWSFCIVISYLITGESFYSFLNNGYTEINPNIFFSVNKLKIALYHFLKIYAKKLKHINLYKKIIFMGIKPYKNRHKFSDIYMRIYKYCSKNSINHNLSIINKFQGSPEIITERRSINNFILVKEVHDKLQYHDIIIIHFYKIYNKMVNKDFQFNDILMISLYILIIMLMLDNNNSISYYIGIINSKLKYKSFTKELVECSIITIMNTNNFNII